MQPDNTVRIDTHAAATLKYIRASMEAAASLAVPGSAGIAMGSVGLLAAALSLTLPDLWLPIWLISAVVAGSLGTVLMTGGFATDGKRSPEGIPRETGRSSLRTLTLAGAPLRKFALCLLPSLFAGAVMTAVHWQRGDLHAIPGTWLLLYGCALISASAATNATIAIMGGAFLMLGLLALVLPVQAHLPLLAAGFGGLHLLFGFLIGRDTTDRDSHGS